mmetsp:Transcript_56609/g.111846  ORF Transcript_56609/g.111846 Transcript_56609/m.111846 type:complete len:301 (+) Transcript_56609:158-1060(+)
MEQYQDQQMSQSLRSANSTGKEDDQMALEVKSVRRRPRTTHEVAVSPIQKAFVRTGLKLGDNRYFSKDKRWREKDDDVGAPQYLLKPMRSERESAFGTSTREDWGRIMGLIPKTNPNAGPGSYRIVETMVLSSEMPRQATFRFPNSARPSMDLKTLGPGPVYELDGKFKHGKDTKISTGFNLDHRKPLVDSATDAMYHPPLSQGVSCTIKKRREPSLLRLNAMRSGPAPHDYDVVGSSARLQKQPSFSFGKSADRFKGADKVSEMIKSLESAEAMQDLMIDLPSVSSVHSSEENSSVFTK